MKNCAEILKMQRVCIVTEEFAGLTPSGGIGACAKGLALHLASTGRLVDILITNLEYRAEQTASPEDTNISFHSLLHHVSSDVVVSQPKDDVAKSYCVYRFLRTRKYQAVHFNDWLGSGFYTALARRQGSYNSTVITHAHGSSEWVRTHNLHLPNLDDLEREALERSQLENSDIVVSPSAYLIEWYTQKGIEIPNAQVINWILPQWIDRAENNDKTSLSTRAIAPRSIEKYIYFGRHERRKGIELFVDALCLLPEEYQKDVHFVGRFDQIDREFTGSYILRKLSSYRGQIEFSNDLWQRDALSLIKRSANALCIMPSLIENSPCVIGECLSMGTPFLGTDVGGAKEMLELGSAERCLVTPKSGALVEAIQRVVNDGMEPIVSNLEPSRIRSRWTELHENLTYEDAAGKRTTITDPALPLVSVCLVHFERPELLKIAIDSLLRQTYRNFEIIVVDDGSKSVAAHSYLTSLEESRLPIKLKVVRSENRYLGAARNLAAANAEGEYLLFHDDDNFAEPEEIEVFTNAAIASKADILTAQCFVFTPQEFASENYVKQIRYYPIGIGGAFSYFRNRFGDANALVKKSSFERIGGFSQLYGVGFEDWEFFLKAYESGFQMAVVPEPLFNYRATEDGMLGSRNVSRNFERVFAATRNIHESISADLVRLANRDSLGREILELTWHRLGKERFSDLHHQMTSLDPNSAEAKVKLSELAFAMGRFKDALHLAFQDYNQREKIVSMLQATNRVVGVRSLADAKIWSYGPTGSKDAIFIEGWAVYLNGDIVEMEYIIIGHTVYKVVGSVRTARPDVRDHFSLASDQNLGFTLIAMRQASPVARARHLLSPVIDMPMTRSTIGRAAYAVTKNRKARAHIDKFAWCRLESVPDMSDFNPSLMDVDIGATAAAALMREDGTLTFGHRVGIGRHRFYPTPELLSQAKLVLDSSVRCDLIAA